MNTEPFIFTEVFPVQLDTLPQLFAYKLDVVGGDISTIGGKLSYRLRQKFPGHWVWTSYRIVTDSPQNQSEIIKLIETLWNKDQHTYRSLRGAEEDPEWNLSPLAQAQLVARGLFSDIHADIQKKLQSKSHDTRNACDVYQILQEQHETNELTRCQGH